MNRNEYTILNKFNCCGTSMVSVIMGKKAACVMTELEYNRIIEAERKFRQKKRFKRTA